MNKVFVMGLIILMLIPNVWANNWRCRRGLRQFGQLANAISFLSHDEVNWVENRRPPEALLRSMVDLTGVEYRFKSDLQYHWLQQHNSYFLIRDYFLSGQMNALAHMITMKAGVIFFRPLHTRYRQFATTLQRVGMTIEADASLLQFSELDTFPREVGGLRVSYEDGSFESSRLQRGHSSFVRIINPETHRFLERTFANGKKITKIEFVHTHPGAEFLAFNQNGHLVDINLTPLSFADINMAHRTSRMFRGITVSMKAVTAGGLTYEVQFKNGRPVYRTRWPNVRSLRRLIGL